jgi:hypothetical protein
MLDDLDGSPEIPKLKKERDAWKKAAQDAGKELELTKRRLHVHERLSQAHIAAPKWARPKSRRLRQATALLMLSDLHLDEVVKPEEILGLNAFNRDIALMRLTKIAQQSAVMARDYLSGFTYDGAVLLLGGDIFTGIIHEELTETNEAPILASLEYWLDPLAGVVQLLADEFGKLLVVGVVGNHGRLSRKWKYKGTVQDNFDWFLYRQLVRAFKSDPRVSWNIPISVDAYFDVYDHRHLLTHGNQARGGSGIAGLATPLALFDHRKRKRDASTIGAASHTWIGHFHQYMPLNGLTVNGSLKGADDYSFGNNFPYEEAQQAFALITPEHNVTIQTSLFAQDREAEGW